MKMKMDMDIESQRQLAREMGLPEKRDSSSDKILIRAIQKQRGEEPCFLSDERYNCNKVCEWRSRCKKLKAVWLR